MPDFTRRAFDGGDPSPLEITQTDRLLDALAGEQPVYSYDSGEAELAYLLAGWRDEIRQPPMASVVTPRDAAIALDRATTSTARRRFSLAVVGSVAAAVLCLGGFGSVVYGAGPGDPLYGVRTMLFGGQQATRDDQVALAAQTQMAQVRQLIEQGDWTAAQDKLQTLTTTVAAVEDTGRQQELVDQWQQLSVKVQTRDPAATVPPDAPPVVLPEVPSDLLLPALLSPDATPPSDSTSPATTPPSSTDPSDAPTTPLPSSTVPTTSAPSTVPSTTVPSTTVPTTTVPSTTVPSTTVPSTTVPSTTVPSKTVPSTTVPSTTRPVTTTPPRTPPTTPPTTSPAPSVTVPQTTVTSTVERPQVAAPVVTTTGVSPMPGSAAEDE